VPLLPTPDSSDSSPSQISRLPLSVIPRSGPSQIPHLFSHFPKTSHLSSCTTHQLSPTLTYTQMPKFEFPIPSDDLSRASALDPLLFIPYLRLTSVHRSPSSSSRLP
jgi:hypothetical protein